MNATAAAELKDWIGRAVTAADTVTPRLIESYRATLTPYLAMLDESGTPLGVHWCLAPPLASLADLGPDGHPATGGFMPPVPLSRRVWAGGEVEFCAPLQVGDDVMRTSTIANVRARQGRSGPLVVVEVRHELSVSGRVAIRERQDIIYRVARSEPFGAASDFPPESDPLQPDFTMTWDVQSSPVLLFRYSAVTFNTHRIHYDLPYATAVEGYAGLVVHGPLQATLLLNLAASLLRRCPRRFEYRSVAPLIANQPFKARGLREEQNHVDCRIYDAAGRLTSQARATP